MRSSSTGTTPDGYGFTIPRLSNPQQKLAEMLWLPKSKASPQSGELTFMIWGDADTRAFSRSQSFSAAQIRDCELISRERHDERLRCPAQTSKSSLCFSWPVGTKFSFSFACPEFMIDFSGCSDRWTNVCCTAAFYASLNGNLRIAWFVICVVIRAFPAYFDTLRDLFRHEAWITSSAAWLC